eukprot:766939-Hanusia_phi.AAC.8
MQDRILAADAESSVLRSENRQLQSLLEEAENRLAKVSFFCRLEECEKPQVPLEQAKAKQEQLKSQDLEKQMAQVTRLGRPSSVSLCPQLVEVNRDLSMRLQSSESKVMERRESRALKH